MPWSNGTYTRGYASWTNDANNSLPISATKFDTEDNDFASGLQNCLTIDGLNKPTATLNWPVQVNWSRATDGNVWSIARTSGSNNPKLQGSVTDATGATLAVTGGALALTATGAISITATGNLTLATSGNLILPTNLGTPMVLTTPASGVALTVNGLGTGTEQALQVNGAGSTQIASFDSTAAGGAYITYTRSSTAKAYFGDASQLSGGTLDDLTIRSQGAKIGLAFSGSAPVFQVTTAAMQGLGPVAAALVDMTPDKGTFTATLTGCTTSPTVTASWARIGNLVFLYIPSVTATSNANTCTMTGLPAAIQPATLTQNIANSGEWLMNNANSTTSQVVVTAGSGTLTFQNATGTFTFSSTAWTASGSKGVGAAMILTYLLL